MSTNERPIQLSKFRDFVIEATAVKVGAGWRPQFRIVGGARTISSLARVRGYERRELAIAAAIDHAINEIKRGKGSCFT